MSEIKQRLLDQISTYNREHVEKYVDKQNEKGVATYGQILDDCPPEKYDWKDMLIEELIDGLQYAHKRAIEAEKETARVKALLDAEKARMASINV